MSEIRSFIAIEIPETILQKFAIVTNLLPVGQSGGIRWIHPSNIHLTLRFLGNISPNDLDGLGRILNGITIKHSVFKVTIQKVGAFPNRYSPRIVWVGVDPTPELLQIQDEIETQLTQMDYKSENRPFTPHVTIGRVSDHFKQVNPSLISEILARFQNEYFGSYFANEIKLFRSELRPTGAIYSTLHVAKLQSIFSERGDP